MLKKKDFEADLRKRMNILRGRKSLTTDELDAFGRDMPVRVMKDGTLLCNYCVEKGLSMTDCMIIYAWVVSQYGFIGDVKLSSDVSYSEAVRCYEAVRTNTIIIHRLNYMLHECMIAVRDVLEKDGRLRFAVKKAYNEADKVWDVYYHDRRRKIEDSIWYALSDHLRLADSAIGPWREKVYEAVRDYMIGHNIRDIELKGRCAVFFLMAKVCGHSARQLFDDFRKDCGIDFSACFSDDDLHGMVGGLADVCRKLGIRMVSDEYGFLRLEEFDPDKSQRFLWAWDGLMKALRDDDLMDAMAQKAISYNPEVRRDYERALEEEQQKQMDESIGQLGSKYKISSL